MVQGKVEICGVNTSKLPILKEEEKEEESTQPTEPEGTPDAPAGLFLGVPAGAGGPAGR